MIVTIFKFTSKGRGIQCRPPAFALCGRPLDALCVTAGWSLRVNWVEVDKREGGVKQEWGFGRYSIVLPPPSHHLLKGHQQYSNT